MRWLAVPVVALGLTVFSACGEDRHDWWLENGFSSPGGGEESNLQDVIPINGDSSAPVDEIMDAGLQLAAIRSWGPSPPARPIAVYTTRPDGEMDLRAVSPAGMTADDFEKRASSPIVLSPLAASSRAGVERYLESLAPRGSGTHVMRARVHAYCVEARKQAAAAGTLYVAAPAATVQRFAPVQRLLRFADRAIVAGILKPQGDPVAYGHFIAQYAVWTELEGWDEPRFTTEFITRTRQTVIGSHETWSDESERTLRAVAPARWRDVQFVIANAAARQP
jgi:hypothetical protein